MPEASLKTGNRILALDYLRGFFILVIIIDHLDRWPSLFALVTGQDSLWASAAEGFVIISGLLLGYVRGFKARHSPMKEVTRVVLRRAIILYAWVILCTILLSVATWYLTFQGSIAYVDVARGDWLTLIQRVVTLDFVHVLPYFLYLYAIFLAISPLALLLLRKGHWIIVVTASVIAWIIGTLLSIQWLQWVPVFFLATVAGYYLETIALWFGHFSVSVRRIIANTFMLVTAATMLIAASPYLETLDQFFGRSPLDAWRILIAGIWFVGLLFFFQRITPFLTKYVAWLLYPLGSRSLTAYIVHSLPLMIIALFIPVSANIVINTLLGAFCVLATWALIRAPFIQKIIPR